MTSTETQTWGIDTRQRISYLASVLLDAGSDPPAMTVDELRGLLGVGALWGPGEITRNLGVSRATMKRWRDAGGFPEPYQELSIGPVWLAEDVRKWAEERKR
jgi:predicted DNA-binding transcriptional regulator AlpA